MIITIYEGFDDSYLILGSNHEEFVRKYGSKPYVSTKSRLYKTLAEIASWVNNELGEECLFEID